MGPMASSYRVTAHLLAGRAGPPRERGRQIRAKALRRSHFGSDPSLGGPEMIIAVPLLLIDNDARVPKAILKEPLLRCPECWICKTLI